MIMLYQCKLRHGEAEMISWIAERGAKVGAVVTVLNLDAQDCARDWTVAEVYQPPMSADALRAKQPNDRNALPSIAERTI